MMDAGTTIPPIPRPATISRPQSWCRLSRVAIAREPQPAVIRTEETTSSSLLWPRKNGEEPKDYASAREDRKADRDTTNTNPNRIVAVDIEGLCGPEHYDGEEIGAGDEGDHQSEP